MSCDKVEGKGDGEELKENIDRICESLNDDPKNLRNKAVEDAILSCDVN